MAGAGGLASTPIPAGNPPPTPVPAAPTPSAVTSDAQAQIDKANAATLAQLAGSTQAGVNAGNAAVQAGQADKAKAVQGLLTSAIMGGSGAPQQGRTTSGAPNQAQALQGILGNAYDQRIGTTGDLTAAFQAANANREAGASNYFQEAGAALPIVQAAAVAKIAAAQQAAQLALETHQLALQTAQARLANGGASSPTAASAPALGGGEVNLAGTGATNAQEAAIGGVLSKLKGTGQSLQDALIKAGARTAPSPVAATGEILNQARADAKATLDAGHPAADVIAAIDAKYGPGVGAQVVGHGGVTPPALASPRLSGGFGF